jgi:hypothetical protein
MEGRGRRHKDVEVCALAGWELAISQPPKLNPEHRLPVETLPRRA